MPRRTAVDIRNYKKRQEKIASITAYDAPTARLAEAAGIDFILVGDSVATAVLGFESTIDVGMSEMLHHCRAVVRGTNSVHVVMDLPFMSYQAGEDDAVFNAGRALKEGGAQAVKLEGGVRVAPLVARLTDIGIPVMGHVGLKPQSVNQLGGYSTQGRDIPSAEAIINDARALEQAGAYSIVIEKIPVELARHITGLLSIPTIGIGSGLHCDGQVLVLHDALGFDERLKLKHAREYASLAAPIRDAIAHYVADVRTGAFPGEEHSVHAGGELSARLGNK